MTKQEALEILKSYVCLCGIPAKALKCLHEYLGRNDKFGHVISVRHDATPETWLVAYLLDAMCVTEHDTSISTSYLTDKGEMLVNALNVAEAYGYDYEQMMEDE